jgi:hypothetical protein
MKKEIVEELKQEKKQTVKFEDFGLKTLDANDMQKKEAMIVEGLKKGEIPPEMISGELKLHFDEGTNIMQILDKAIPFVVINITQFSENGEKKV